MPIKIAVLLSMIILSACKPHDATLTNTSKSVSKNSVDTLYINGVVWTGEKSAGDRSVMAIKNGAVEYIGNDIPRGVSAKETIDLQGKFVMPGFVDNHVHFFEGGYALASVDLRDAASPEEFSQRIATYAQTKSPGQWVLNGNWDHQLWGGNLPHKDWIDAQTADTPVFVIRLDGHMALANSAALKKAGIDSTSKAPSGGEIVVDKHNNPTGILKGNALNLMLAIIPKPSNEEVLQAFSLAQSHALSLGLTQVHGVTANPTETSMLDDFRLAYDRGVMKIRAVVYTPIEHWQTASALVTNEGTGDHILRWGGVKGFVDGSLGSGTAWFHQPFSDDPDNHGAPLTPPDDLKRMLIAADSSGLKLAIHAIGDKAIDTIIEDMRTLAKNDIKERRYRIEHFQHPSAEAIETVAKEGIIVSMQPYHAIDDGRWAEERVGAQRIKTTYAFRTILDAGGLLTFGSDWPVAPLSPLAGVYAAVTRRTTDDANPDGWQPQEKISVEEALTAYTATNAYAAFEEQQSGTLAKGKRADFVLLSQDPRVVEPVDIQYIKVLQTVIGGETVYKRDE